MQVDGKKDPDYRKCMQENSRTNLVPPDQKSGIIQTGKSLECICACEDLCWNHPLETHGIAENAVRSVKESTNALLVQSGLSEQVVEGSDGMLLLFAKHTRESGRQKATV